MTALADIRAAIVATIESVPGIGRVHAWQRYTRDAGRLRELYVDVDGQVRGWYLRRVAARETAPSLGRADILRRWQIVGFASLIDDVQSEEAFDALIEALGAAFRADETLGGTVAGTSDGQIAGLQLEDSGPVMFAGVLCHSAKLALVTQTYE